MDFVVTYIIRIIIYNNCNLCFIANSIVLSSVRFILFVASDLLSSSYFIDPKVVLNYGVTEFAITFYRSTSIKMIFS